MGGYFAYFTDDDGHITGRVTILASNDEEAKEQAQLLVDGYPVELWKAARFRHSIRVSRMMDQF
jgi:hypothetical protein